MSIADLVYNYSIKIDAVPKEYFSNEVETQKSCAKFFEKAKDISLIEGLPFIKYWILILSLMRDEKIKKSRIYHTCAGQLDIEIKDKELYLHVFISKKETKNDELKELDYEIKENLHENSCSRVVLDNISPLLKNEGIERYLQEYSQQLN